MELFRLVGSILVDNDKANKSIHKTSGEADTLAGKFLTGAKAVGKFALGAAAAATAVGGAMLKIASDTAKAADNVDKMSQRLGLSRQSFQELDYVLSQSDVDINSMQTGMKSLLKNMDGATSGGKKQAEMFKQLGVSVSDSNGKMRSQEEVLKDTIIAFQNMENSSEKSRLAQELFGKQGQEMLPLLNAEAGSFEALTQQANELGLVMGDDAVDAGVEFTDNMDTVKRSIGALWKEIGAQLLPIVNDMLKWFINHMPQIREITGQAFSYIGKVIDALRPIVTTTFNFIASTMTNVVIPAITKGIEIFNNVINKASEMKEKFTNAIENIKTVFSSLSFKMPSMKLPHFNVKPSGWKISDLLTGSIPKLGVEWYAKAMDEPMLFNKPTVFATPGGLKGVGEAGNEYVSGENGIKKAVAEVLQNMNLTVVLDSGQVVGAIAPKLDKQLYKRQLKGARGL